MTKKKYKNAVDKNNKKNAVTKIDSSANKKCLLTQKNGERLSSTTSEEILGRLGLEGAASFSPIVRIESSNQAYSAGVSKSGRIFSRRLTLEREGNEALSLWIEQDPSHSGRLSVMEELDEEASTGPNLEMFEFDISKENIKTTQRNQSQNQVKSGSAKDHLRSQGVKVDDNDVPIHWAHRQACIFGGPQSSENLDATTAVSNYETFQCVEKPIQKLIMAGSVKSLHVRGCVHFFQNRNRLATKLEVNVSNQSASARAVFDPLGTNMSSSLQKKLMKSLLVHGLRK